MNTRDLIRQRKASGYQAGSVPDGHHLALVFECGGMRATSGAGIAATLERHGLRKCFDSVHGSSAGACVGAYFLAGQTDIGAEIYLTDICNDTYIHPWRGLLGETMVDARRIVNHVMRTVRPLDAAALVAMKNTFFISNTRAKTGETAVYSAFSSPDDLFSKLQATLTVPSYRQDAFISVDGYVEVDGGISAPVTMQSAVAAGATHILIVATRRSEEKIKALARIKTWLEAQFLSVLFGRKLGESYLRTRPERNYAAIAAEAPNAEVDVILRRAGSPRCTPFTTDQKVLRQVFSDAQQAAEDYLAQ